MVMADPSDLGHGKNHQWQIISIYKWGKYESLCFIHEQGSKILSPLMLSATHSYKNLSCKNYQKKEEEKIHLVHKFLQGSVQEIK